MDTDTDALGLRQQLQASLGAAYALGRELGGGGMARVFVAEETTLGRRVVVKVLPPELSGVVHAERFRRESHVAAGLQHPHIVPLLAAGESGGLLFYTMPLVEGETLRARLTRDGALALPVAVRVLRDVARALAYAHRRGVVHRDIKPENVLLGEGGDALVTDFGLAKALAAARDGSETAPPSALTSVGVAVGTPAYSAPEQAAADAATDHRADLYALGVVAYEVLAGSHPFVGRSAHAMLAAHAAEAPELLSRRRTSVPAELAALVMRLLEKHPADRPQSAEAVLQVLDALTPSTASGYRTTGTRSTRRAPRLDTRVAVGAGLLALAAYGGYTAWHRPRATAAPTAAGATGTATAATPAPTRPSLAVLPFANTSGDPADEAFSDGLTDELIGALGKVAGLRVAGRTSAFALKGTRLGVRAVAETLGVGAVLEGSVRRAGGRLKVGAQLVSAADGAVLWTETYDRAFADVFAVQEEIAQAIVGALRGRLGGDAQVVLVHPGTADIAAYEQYLKGQLFFNQRTPAGLRRAVSYFEQAIARDPTYARAYAGLAHAHLVMVVFGNARPTEELPRARAAALRALALDSTVAEAHAALGHLRFVFDWQWAEGLRALDRAIALDPGYAFARQLRGIYLMNRGRLDESATALRDALAVDPLSAAIRMNLGQAYVYAHRPDEAIRHLRDALELNPELVSAHQHLGFAYLQKRMPTEAVAAFAHAAARGGANDSAQLAYAYGITGRRREAEAILRDVLAQQRNRYVQPSGIVLAYVGLGDRDAAFRWLEQGYGEHAAQMNQLKVHPAYEPLHADPRWAALLRRMRLEP
ncbi:MAG: protein kinase [Gemmatimonadaceae bacterium]